jgi:hypothetical protein
MTVIPAKPPAGKRQTRPDLRICYRTDIIAAASVPLILLQNPANSRAVLVEEGRAFTRCRCCCFASTEGARDLAHAPVCVPLQQSMQTGPAHNFMGV